MTDNRHRFNPFEWLVVAVVIGIVIVVGMRYYEAMAEEAVAMSMQINASNFRYSALAVHTYWRLQPPGSQSIHLNERHWFVQGDAEPPPELAIWVNSAGWPVDAGPEAGPRLTEDSCRRLWFSLLKVENSAKVGDILWQALQISQPEAHWCRFSLRRVGGEVYSVDYNSLTGQAVYSTD